MHRYDIAVRDKDGELLSVKSVETGIFFGHGKLGRAIRAALNHTDPAQEAPVSLEVRRRRLLS